MVELHPAVAPLSALLGTWRGRGAGEYPTIDSFEYTEEVTFGQVGKPFLAYSQRTRAADDGRPLHAESGYLRTVGGNRLEFVNVHPFGVVEIEEGTFELTDTGVRIELGSLHIHSTATAKQVDQIGRTFVLDGDSLTYEVRMAAVGEPFQHHLAATLQRADG